MVAGSLPVMAMVAGQDLLRYFDVRGDAMEAAEIVMVWKYFVAINIFVT